MTMSAITLPYFQIVVNCLVWFCRLKDAKVPVRFVTNETTTTRYALVEKLQSFGFDLLEEEVFPPAPAARRILQERGLRPHLLIAEGE